MFVMAFITYLSITGSSIYGLESLSKLWQGAGSYKQYKNDLTMSDTNQTAKASKHAHKNINSYGNGGASLIKHPSNALPSHKFDWEEFDNHLEISPITQHIGWTKPVSFTNSIRTDTSIAYPQEGRINIPHQYPANMPVLQSIGVPMIKTVFVPIEKKIPYAIEKIVPVPVEKPVLITIEKHIPIAMEKPYPIHIPVYKNIFHRVLRGGDQSHGCHRPCYNS